MNKYLVALLGTAFVTVGPALADDTVLQDVDQDYGYLESLYTYLHQHPELSFHEEQTAARLGDELRPLGFEVTQNVGGTGIVAVLKNGDGPTVLLRTDLDALPVHEQTNVAYASTVVVADDLGNQVSAMHACGHDVHMTVFVGTARRLAAMRDSWSGTLVMIGQPAEERGAGARAMLNDGLYERFPLPDYNIALHTNANMPAGQIGYRAGFALANVDSVDITIHGIGGHGAYPHTTRDPVMLAAQIITSLQTLVSRNVSPLDAAVVTVGSIHGGAKHNIISDRVDLQITVRSYKDEVRATLLDGIRRIAINTARAADFPDDKLPDVTIRDEGTPATYNDPALTNRIVSVFRENFGDDGLLETDPVMGGEDFSEYGRTDDKIPGFMFWLGGVDPEKFAAAKESGTALPSLHSPFFAPLPEPTIKRGVEAMTLAALELFDTQ